MNKINGLTSEFALVKEEGSRTVISYGFKAEQGGKNATWYEVYFPKKQGKPNLEAVKKAVIADINARTDEKIINGYPFTPDGAEEPIIVWLSKESQMDFSEAHRLQIVPVKFKLNETPDNQPIYHTFDIRRVEQILHRWCAVHQSVPERRLGREGRYRLDSV